MKATPNSEWCTVGIRVRPAQLERLKTLAIVMGKSHSGLAGQIVADYVDMVDGRVLEDLEAIAAQKETHTS